MTLEESREIIPLMESMIGQIEEQQTLMAEMLLEMQNRDTQLSLMQERVLLFYDLIFRYFPRTFYFLPGKKLLFNLSCVSAFMDGRNLEFSLFFIRTVIDLIMQRKMFITHLCPLTPP